MVSNFTRILYVLFIMGTIVVLRMAYNGINSSIALKFGIGYLFLTFFLILYIPIITVLNSKKLEWYDIKRRLIRFIVTFILFGSLNYIFDYVFRPSNINLFRNFSIALGTAFGISFVDVILLKKKS